MQPDTSFSFVRSLTATISVQHVLLAVIVSALTWVICSAFYNVYLHPLARFPGPKLAAASTYWLFHQEFVRGISLSDIRDDLHSQYGDIIRVQPNLLHFANPHAYNDIYNLKNKWDKDSAVYGAFDTDQSSACFIKYEDAKPRRDVLSPMFSRSSILKMQGLLQERVDVLCDALAEQYAAGKSSNLYLGFRCFATDVLTLFCYNKSLEATKAPDFEAEIVVALESMLPILSLCKYSSFLVKLLHYFPAWLAKNSGSPVLSALFRLRELLAAQVDAVLRDPTELTLAPHQIIYHALLSPEANKGRALPSRQSLIDEALILLGAGADSTGIVLTVAAYYVLHDPHVRRRLEAELREAWPVLEEVPRYEVLEKLPYLAAVTKEGLRMFPGVIGHPRVVPPQGALISGAFIPGGTVVGQSFCYVHRSPLMYERPEAFWPERWLGPGAKACESALSAFSKGPRSCFGVNLAYAEIHMGIANVFRRFELRVDEARPASLAIKEHFVPLFIGEHLHAYCKPAKD
ncbi:putative P450 monooxygenase [Russula earlei]|uniref:P450 monooxygenase n=1 Tax=Russula earlei TaxID=71964 RepID=A0ACC0UJ83_9AGAM|nr:putative P450 monooxygenase [Russula earlei]